MEISNIGLIDIDKLIQDKAPRIYSKLPKFVISYIIKKAHQKELNEILEKYAGIEGVDFMKALVQYFNLNLNIIGLNNIPRNDRYIFVANHPLGGLDGICLSAVIGEKFDGQVKYLVNDLLMHIPNTSSIFVPVNKHGAQSKKGVSIINETFASNDQIITFPAGLCSRKKDGKIHDLEWKKTFIDKAIEYQRTVVPIYFDGYNSKTFYRLAAIRKCFNLKFNLEMLLLPDEMFKNKNKTFTITIGNPIFWQDFNKSKTTKEWAEFVKKEVYDLVKKQ